MTASSASEAVETLLRNRALALRSGLASGRKGLRIHDAMLDGQAASEIDRLRAEVERLGTRAEDAEFAMSRLEKERTAAEARAASAEAERDEALNCPPGYVEATNAIIEGLKARLAVMDGCRQIAVSEAPASSMAPGQSQEAEHG